MTDHPLIFVDLVEEKPLSRMIFDDTYGVSGDDADTAYRDYLDRFQPWRVIVRSGGNHKILFRSSERYFHGGDARRAAELAFGPDATVYLRCEGGDRVELRRGLS